MRNELKRFWLLALVCAFLIAGCNSDDDDDTTPAVGEAIEEVQFLAEGGDDRQILVDVPLTLDASQSEGEGLIYHWDFGDGQKADGCKVEHVYSELQDYEVVLTVTNEDGKEATDELAVEVMEFKSMQFPITVACADGSELTVNGFKPAFLDDGRMIGVAGGSDFAVIVETAPCSGEFELLASIPREGNSYPAFLEVVDGDTVAVGLWHDIWLVETADGSASHLVTLENYEGCSDGEYLYVTGGNLGSDTFVHRVSIADGAVEMLLTVPGASGDACVDPAGNVYVGNGFSAGHTGDIVRFDPKNDFPWNWDDGSLVGKVLSAGNLHWFNESCILVGGGDYFGDSGNINYVAAYDTASGEIVRKVDPDPGDGSFYMVTANAKSDRMALCTFSGGFYYAPLSALGL